MIHIQGNGGHALVIKDLLETTKQEYGAQVAVIAVGKNADRKAEAERLAANFTFVPALVHPSASVSRMATLGEGTVVMAGAIVQAGARIGKHVIINTAASVDHGCVIGDYAHIGPGVHLCGGVCVGEGALLGVGSCAVPGAKVAAWELVRAGTVVK